VLQEIGALPEFQSCLSVPKIRCGNNGDEPAEDGPRYKQASPIGRAKSPRTARGAAPCGPRPEILFLGWNVVAAFASAASAFPRLSQSTLVGRLRLRGSAANASRPLSLLKPKAASVLMALAHRDLVAPFHHVAFHRPDQLPARYSIAIRVTQAEERRWKCKYLGAQECTLT
jgi:hypothetical protein